MFIFGSLIAISNLSLKNPTLWLYFSKVPWSAMSPDGTTTFSLTLSTHRTSWKSNFVPIMPYNTEREVNIFDLKMVNQTLQKFFSRWKAMFTKTHNISKETAISPFAHSFVKSSRCSKQIFKRIPKTFTDPYSITEGPIPIEEKHIRSKLQTIARIREVCNVRTKSDKKATNKTSRLGAEMASQPRPLSPSRLRLNITNSLKNSRNLIFPRISRKSMANPTASSTRSVAT